MTRGHAASIAAATSSSRSPGGVGVTGLLSMLRTMADREDVRPTILIYANGDWEGVAFREELERSRGA